MPSRPLPDPLPPPRDEGDDPSLWVRGTPAIDRERARRASDPTPERAVPEHLRAAWESLPANGDWLAADLPYAEDWPYTDLCILGLAEKRDGDEYPSRYAHYRRVS